MIDYRAGVRVGVNVGAVALGLLACVGATALAALPNPLADGLRHCAGESDQAKRLACFDALAAGLPKVEADQFGLTADIARKRQPQVKSQPPATVAGGMAAGGTAPAAGTTGATTNKAATPTAASTSGAAATAGAATRDTATASTATTGGVMTGSARTAAVTGTAAPNTAQAKPGEEVLPGKITALRQASGGVLVFTLDNDQVWVQADADSRFSFKVGDDVRIEHGAMGSFWLAANKGRKTKVKRVS